MPQARSRGVRPGRVAAVVVVAGIGLAILLLAGVPAIAHVVVVGVALVGLGLLVFDRRRERRSLQVPVVALPFGLGAVLTLFSLLPLPASLRTLLAPESVDRLQRVLAVLTTEARQLVRPVLAFDPPEASLALLRLLFALVVVVVIANATRSREGRRVVFRALLAVSFVTAFAVLFAEAVGIPRVLDVVGVPVNPNHRARVCGALALLCLMRAATLRARVEATWFATAGTALAFLVFATLSKGGIAALLVGVVVAIALVFAHGQSNAVRIGAPAAGATLVVAAGVWLGDRALTGLGNEMARPGGLKTFLWEPSLRVASVEPFVGVGNNGFGVVFPSVLGRTELDPTLTYSHPENIVLQTLADHGVVLGLVVLLLALGVALTAGRVLLPSPRAGALVALPALVFLLVGDLFDFALETPAGLALCALALGLLGGRLIEAERGFIAVPAKVGAAFAVVAAVVVAAVAPGAVSGWRYALDEEIADAAPAARQALLQAALAQHPSDAAFATELAIDARRRRDPQAALRFSNRAMNLWPALAEAHREAARALFAIGHATQGLLEYREVWLSGGNVVGEVAARTRDPALRRIALPVPVKAAHLGALCNVLVKEKRSDEARACFDDVVALDDATPAQKRTRIELALVANDLEMARAGILSLPQPLDGDDAALGARVLAKDDAVAALATTAAWLTTTKNPQPLLQWRLAEQRKLNLYDDAEATIALLRPLARTPAQAGQLDTALVEVRSARGDVIGALDALRKALNARPRDLHLLFIRLRLEASSGNGSAARETLATMKSIAPDDKRVVAGEKLLSP